MREIIARPLFRVQNVDKKVDRRGGGEKKARLRDIVRRAEPRDLITRMIFKGWMSFIPKADGDTLWCALTSVLAYYLTQECARPGHAGSLRRRGRAEGPESLPEASGSGQLYYHGHRWTQAAADANISCLQDAHKNASRGLGVCVFFRLGGTIPIMHPSLHAFTPLQTNAHRTRKDWCTQLKQTDYCKHSRKQQLKTFVYTCRLKH